MVSLWQKRSESKCLARGYIKNPNVESKMVRQSISMAWNSDICCSYDYRLIKGDFEDKNNSKVKKTPNTSINHNSSGNSQSAQLGQTLGQILDQFTKKSSYLQRDKKLANSLALWPLKSIPLQSKKIKSRAIRTWARSNALLITKNVIMQINIPTWSHKTSVAFSNLCVKNWD